MTKGCELNLYSEWLMRLYFFKGVKGTVKYFMKQLSIDDKTHFYEFLKIFLEKGIFEVIPEDEIQINGINCKTYKINQDRVLEFLSEQTFFQLPFLILEDYSSFGVLDTPFSKKQLKEMEEKWKRK